MISVDKALSIYTDKRNNNEEVDLKEFQEQMTTGEYAELLELTSFMDLVIETDSISHYVKVFEQLDLYKDEIYNLPMVSNFRTTGGKATKDTMERIDKIFDEEFGDE